MRAVWITDIHLNFVGDAVRRRFLDRTWHRGKVSDKWHFYLEEYDRILSAYREEPVRILEIGVQIFLGVERVVGFGWTQDRIGHIQAILY